MLWEWFVCMAKRNYLVRKLRQLVVRNNVFRNNIEGEIMYNYKFDDTLSKRVENHICDKSGNLLFEKICKELCYVLRVVPFDIEVVELLDDYCQNIKDNVQIIKPSGIEKMMLDCIKSDEEQTKDKSQISSNNQKLCEVDFQLSVLQGMYTRYIASGVLGQALKIGKEIRELQAQRNDVLSNISNISNKVSENMHIFLSELKAFLKKIKQMKVSKLIESSDDFDSKVFDFYRKFLVFNLLQKYIDKISIDEFVNWLDSDSSRDYTADRCEEIKSVARYVGTNN